jgi:DNA-binding CsgD family transcriptional regulator
MAPAPVAQPVRREVGSGIFSWDEWLHVGDSLRLSDRELLVVQGIFDDRELENIADILGVPTNVVYRTLQRIYIKLQIGSRAELVVRVMSEYVAFAADQPAW